VSPEAKAFLLLGLLLLPFYLGGFIVVCRIVVRVARREMRLDRSRERRRRHIRAVFGPPEQRRAIGFLSHLNERTSEPPPSAFVHVLPAREPVVYRPTRAEPGREVMRPRCRTR
jgi:hypothetical protein